MSASVDMRGGWHRTAAELAPVLVLIGIVAAGVIGLPAWLEDYPDYCLLLLTKTKY